MVLGPSKQASGYATLIYVQMEEGEKHKNNYIFAQATVSCPFFFYKGKLCDASARYERAIQEEPGEIGHHKVEYYSVLHNG